MYKLITFGGLALIRSDEPVAGPLLQRSQLALLAVIASVGSKGISRDKLIALFWPEADTEHARRALNQNLYSTRRQLGSDDAVLGSSDLRLNPSIVASDVTEFENAVAEQEWESAATLYKGPFLDGIHMKGSAEFERWSAAQRARYEADFIRGLEALAKGTESNGDHAAAAGWWRRLAMHDLLNGRYTAALIRALGRNGDYAFAVAQYKAHELALQQDLGTTPSSSVLSALAEVEDLARGNGRVSGPTQDALQVDPSPGSLARHAVSLAPAESPRNGNEGPVAAHKPPAGKGRYTYLRIASLAALTLAVVAALWFPRSGPSAAASPEINDSAVAVFPFQIRGHDSYAYLREGLPDLLNIRLNGAGTLRAVDPRALAGVAARDSTLPIDVLRGRSLAQRAGAGQYILGHVIEAGGKLHVVAKLYDRNANAIGEAEVDGRPEDLAQLVDRLAGRLMASVNRAPGERLLQTAALTTSSFPALKAYLIGEQEFRVSRFGAAADAFQRAVKEDTTFALAYYRMAVAAESAPWNDAATDSAARNAVRFASRLPLRDRELFSAFLARRRGDHEEAAQKYRIVVGLYPDEVEAWYQLAEIEFHYDPFRGLPLSAAKRSYERVIRLRPADPGALTHLYRIAAREGNRVAIDSLRRSLLRVTPEKTLAPEFLTFHGAAMRDSALIERGLAELSTVADEFVTVTMRHVAMFTLDVHTYGRIARLLVDLKRDVEYRAQGYHALANSHLARGQLRDADAVLQRQPGFGQDWSIELRGLYAALPFLPSDALALDSLRKALTSRRAVRPMPPPLVGYERLYDGWDRRLAPYALGLIALRSGDTASALRYADRLETSKGFPTDSALLSLLSRTIRAELMRARGNPAEALQLLGNEGPVGTLGQLGGAIGSQVYQRYLRAELLGDLGRYQDALRWYQSLVQGSGHEIIYLAPSYLRQAEIYDRLGQTRPAIQNYRRFVELWHKGDPEVQPIVAGARSRIAQLERR